MNSRDIRKIILALIDAAICAVSALVALALRFDISAMPREYLARTLSCHHRLR